MNRLFVEAVAVGIVTVIVGTIVSKLFQAFFKVEVNPACKGWNKYYAMEISLFLTGLVAHYAFELLGLNGWYCKHGVACRAN